MKYTFFFIILIFIACNRKSTTIISPSNPSNVEITSDKTEIEAPIKPSIESIDDLPHALLAMRKTPCYGKCPVYEVRFMSDGRVTWYGKKHTDRIGHYEAFVSQEQIEHLQIQIKNSQFQTFAPTYPTNADKMIMDLPQTITKIQMDGQVLQVSNNYDAPKTLVDLEDYVINELDKLVWRKID